MVCSQNRLVLSASAVETQLQTRKDNFVSPCRRCEDAITVFVLALLHRPNVIT